jgi:uncharacterized protein (TIGR00290 family)
MPEKQGVKNAVVSWTGGKDGCYACYRAMEAGYRITRLLHFTNRKKRGSHELNPAIIRAQSDATGITLIQRDFLSYEREFGKVVSELREQGERIDAAVFGHIQTHGGLVERMCRDLDLGIVMPLWKRDPSDLIREMIDAGFEMIVVSARADVMGKEWLGRKIDGEFPGDIQRLKLPVDPCGENGEFHTLVTDGPIFRKRLEITHFDRAFHDGYWYMDIRNFLLQEKR